MQIGGFQKNSMIDFPGAVACVVFTPGCNFTCPYCHNPDLAAGPPAGGKISEDEVLAFLKRRKGLLDGVAITGGEPTLQPGLTDFIQTVRNFGFRVKLDTNGSRPRVLQQLLEDSLVDYLAMDIKTGPSLYPMLMKGGLTLDPIRESIRIIMETAVDYEFRTTCVRPWVDEAVMTEIAGLVRGARRHILQKCSRNVTVLDPDFMTDRNRFFTDEEMAGLQAILAGSVETAAIR